MPEERWRETSNLRICIKVSAVDSRNKVDYTVTVLNFGLLFRRKHIDIRTVTVARKNNSGVVKVSTGVMKLEKLSAGDASNHKTKNKR